MIKFTNYNMGNLILTVKNDKSPGDVNKKKESK